jgi:arylformamidase
MRGDERAWNSWPLERREREYSPSSCIASAEPYLAAYASRSREAAERLACRKDIHWGEGPDERVDFFPAASADAPLLLFIHGGYWQELSKNESSFAAPDCVANGIAYTALDYTLAPKATLATIVEQCRRAVAYLHREAAALKFDARKLFVAGSSAGAHLAAMLLVSGWQARLGLPGNAVAGAVLLSGIFDVEPLIGTYIDAALHLTETDAATLSPVRLPLGRPAPTVVAWGENETGEFKRHSRWFASRLEASGSPVSAFEVPGANHFDIVFGLANRASPLGRATLGLILGGGAASPEGLRGTSRRK